MAVIDGKTLKITPMRLANIPPPIALYELDLHGNALDVVVSAKDGITSFGVLFDDAFSYYEWKLPEDFKKKPILKWTATTPIGIQIPEGHTTNLQKCINQCVSIDQGNQLSILQTTIPESRKVVAEVQDGEIRHSSQSFNQNLVQASSRSGDQMSSPTYDQTSLPPREICLSSGRLRVDGRELAKNCTSFLTTPSHLIFTTSQHLLKFVHMTEVEKMVVPGDTPETDERCRTIERGALLVTVMPSNFALVLQMPRGNLETIYPRALVLAGIRDSIKEKKYKKAFLACRNHRVDMNILHDYNPEAFLTDIELFVDQVKKVEYIDLFLSQLR